MLNDLPIRKIIQLDIATSFTSLVQLDNPYSRGKTIAVGSMSEYVIIRHKKNPQYFLTHVL